MIDFVKYDGVTLTDQWDIVNVSRNSSAMTSKTQTVQGRAGAVLMGTAPAPLQVSFIALVRGQYSEDRRESSRRLRAALQKGGVRRLEFSDDGGLYYLAALKDIKETRYKRVTAWAVTMDVFEPFLFDSKTEQIVSSNGASANIPATKVDGTATTYPVVDLVGAVRGSGGYVEVKIDSGTPMRVTLPTSSASRVIIDCSPSTRSVLVNGTATMLTIDSDWWTLEPGEAHTVAVTAGTVASYTVSWINRWAV